MIDIHCHILPGIDDGPSDMASSLLMARAAADSGITELVATPHLRADFPDVKIDEIADRCEELNAAITGEEIDLAVHPGGEVSLSWALDADDDALRRASYGQRGTDVLIETPTVGGSMLPTLLWRVAARGYRVVLAHPERLQDFHRDADLLQRLVEQGIVLQVNADAVIGNGRRSPVARLAQRLYRSGQASVIASDGHRGQRWRPITALADARSEVVRRLDEPSAAAMLELAPKAIIEGQPLPQLPERPESGLMRRWRR